MKLQTQTGRKEDSGYHVPGHAGTVTVDNDSKQLNIEILVDTLSLHIHGNKQEKNTVSRLQAVFIAMGLEVL